MRAIKPSFFFLILATALLFGCKKETDSFRTESIADYTLNKPGKYIVYRTDSTVFTSFGTNMETRSFQEKHLVDAEYKDAMGRTAFRVFRFMRDSAGLDPWKPSGTFSITILPRSIEVTEDNLRVVRLAAPVRQEFTWKGNQHLPAEPYNNFYDFSNDDNMFEWDFIYTGIHETATLRGRKIDSVLSITQINESQNVPLNGADYAFINFGEEKYAKGIGLIYQDFIMWEYQVVPRPNRKGFGIKRIMIEHN